MSTETQDQPVIEGEFAVVDDGVVDADRQEGGDIEVELDDDGNPVQAAEPDDETEEVEHDGQKYALPKALKPLLLMQADYTKKTQALAEGHKAADELRERLSATLTATTEADEAIVDSRAAVKAIDRQASELKTAIGAVEKELANVDLAALNAMGDEGQALYRQREQYLRQLRIAESALTDEKTKLTGELDAKVKARDESKGKTALEMQQHAAKLIEDRDAALKAKFPAWETEFPQVQAYVAQHFGLAPELVASTPDPRMLEIARYAKLGREAEQREIAAKRVQARVQPATGAAKPILKVAGNSPPRTDPNRMPTADWMKQRQAQVAKNGRR